MKIDENGNITMNNGLYVSGATALNSSLNVSGATTLNSSLSVSGALDVTGDIECIGYIYEQGQQLSRRYANANHAHDQYVHNNDLVNYYTKTQIDGMGYISSDLANHNGNIQAVSNIRIKSTNSSVADTSYMRLHTGDDGNQYVDCGGVLYIRTNELSSPQANLTIQSNGDVTTRGAIYENGNQKLEDKYVQMNTAVDRLILANSEISAHTN